MMTLPIKVLLEQLEKYYPTLTTGLKLSLIEKLFEVTYQKDTRILNYQQVQDSAFFIYKGSAMELAVDPVTLHETARTFWFEKDFPYTTPGLFSREPSPSYIKLLEDTHLVGILFSDYLELKETFPEVTPLTEIIRGHYEMQNRIMEEDFRYPAIKRVRRLELAHPEIYNIAEARYIAQYHRISIKTLSRLKTR